MARRGGFFGRLRKAVKNIADAIGEIFTGGEEEPPRREPPKRKPEPPRQTDPYIFWWDYELKRSRTGYFNHKDIIDDLALEYNLSEEDKQELWRDYLHYMVSKNSHFKRNDIRNPFWQKWGIDPDNFDWHAWRDAMGYEHGARKGRYA